MSPSASPFRRRPTLLAGLFLSLALTLTLAACNDGDEDPDAAAAAGDGAADAGGDADDAAADPTDGDAGGETDGASVDPGNDDADDDAGDQADDDQHADARDLDPELVALACESVGYLAGYADIGEDVDDVVTLAFMREEVELLRAMMEVAHPEPEPGSPEALRLAGLEDADALLQRVDGASGDTGMDLSARDFGRVYDAASHLVVVEDADGAPRIVNADPWFEDPAPLIVAGCDRAEVEAVAGRTLPELFGLGWMAEATGPRPGPLPMPDIVGGGERAMDPNMTMDDPLRACPLSDWTAEVESLGLGFHPFSVQRLCTGDDGIDVSIGASVSSLLDDLGRDPELTDEGVAVSADGQVAALVSTDGVSTLVATPAPDEQVSTQQLIDAVIAAQP